MNASERGGIDRWCRLAVIFLGLWVVGASGGCVSGAQLATTQRHAAELRHMLMQRAEQAGHVAVTAADPAVRASAQQDAMRARAAADALAPALATSGAEAFDRAREFSQWLPEPLRLPALVGIGAAAALARGQRLRRALESVTQGIDAARRADPGFGEAFDRHKDLFRVVQTPAARRVIDRVQRPSVPSRTATI